VLPLAPPRTRPDFRDLRRDAAVIGGVGLLVVTAALVGQALLAAGVDMFLGFPPLFASWAPHVGPGTLFRLISRLRRFLG
jgi:methylthioxylose transferase